MIAVAGQIRVLEPGAPQPRHGAGGSGQGTSGAARRSVAPDPAAGTDQRRPGTSQQVNNCHAHDLLVWQDASSAVSRSKEKAALRLLAGGLAGSPVHGFVCSPGRCILVDGRLGQANEWKRLNRPRIISVEF